MVHTMQTDFHERCSIEKLINQLVFCNLMKYNYLSNEISVISVEIEMLTPPITNPTNSLDAYK